MKIIKSLIMKKSNLSLIIVALYLNLISFNLSGQNNYEEKSEILDLKLELLDSKIELLESKMSTWDAKPKEIDLAIADLESRLQSLNLDPDYINYKLYQLDSL